MGARGIVVNDDCKIALLNKKFKNEYKLVGGGIEENETPEIAFQREVMEETGYRINIDKKLGIIKEIKSHDNFEQISYVFIAHVINKVNPPKFTKKEKEEGSRVIWVYLDEAMTLIRNCENNLKASQYENVYHTKFIVRRDYEILNYYKSSSLR